MNPQLQLETSRHSSLTEMGKPSRQKISEDTGELNTLNLQNIIGNHRLLIQELQNTHSS